MIFGDTQTFAIEAELETRSGKFELGHLRFWIGGVAVGDYDDTSDLAASRRWARTFLDASPRRTRADLDDASAAEVFRALHMPEAAAAWDRDPFVLDDVGESSLRDRWSIVVVRRADGRDRMIVRDGRRNTITETTLPTGTCDTVLREYVGTGNDQRPPAAGATGPGPR
ncbi:MAG TPA: Imm42 family immunity protein [Thermoanaerobaculia bacterium]|jgi:hypothetical protein